MASRMLSCVLLCLASMWAVADADGGLAVQKGEEHNTELKTNAAAASNGKILFYQRQLLLEQQKCPNSALECPSSASAAKKLNAIDTNAVKDLITKKKKIPLGAFSGTQCPPESQKMKLERMKYDDMENALTMTGSAGATMMKVLSASATGSCGNLGLTSKCTSAGIPGWGSPHEVTRTWPTRFSSTTFQQYHLFCNSCNSAKAPFKQTYHIGSWSQQKKTDYQNWKIKYRGLGPAAAHFGTHFHCVREQPSFCQVQIWVKKSAPKISTSYHDQLFLDNLQFLGQPRMSVKSLTFVVECHEVRKLVLCVAANSTPYSPTKRCFVTKKSAGVKRVGLRGWYRTRWHGCRHHDDHCKSRHCCGGKCHVGKLTKCPSTQHAGAFEDENKEVKDIFNEFRRTTTNRAQVSRAVAAQCAMDASVF